MTFHTENALAFAPGIIFGELDGGGMVIDRNSGEYVPADQILKDPLHRDQLDVFKEDHLGCLRFGLTDDDSDAPPSDEEEDSDERDAGPVTHFLNEQEELTALIASQEEDMGMAHATCTKGRHAEQSGKSDTECCRTWRARNRGQKPQKHIKFMRKQSAIG